MQPVLRRVKPGSWEPLPETDSPGSRRAAALFSFMETALLIRTKEGEKIPFHFNAIQVVIAHWFAWRWHNGLPIYVIVPKARQMGVSTWWQGVFFSRCVLSHARKGSQKGAVFRAATIAHVDQSADQIFSISRTYHKNLPEVWDYPLESNQQGQIEWKNGSSIWINSIRVADALGKGPTLNGIHFSEVANFADAGINPMLPIGSAMGALAKNSQTIVVYESTAKGRDPFFFGQIEGILRGKASRYTVLFLPWFLMPDYHMPWESYRAEILANPTADDPGEHFVPTEEEQALRRKLASVVVKPGQELLAYRVRLTDEQLIWRRYVIDNEYEGSIADFQRYYPSTLDEAFSATEQNLFGPETVDHYYRASKEPEHVGTVTNDTGTAAFVADSRGKLKVWELPIPGEEYTIGSDPATGKVTGDASCMTVIRNSTWQVVATYHGQTEWDDFAKHNFALGKFYNWARLGIENNNSAVASVVHKMGYPNLYYYFDDSRKSAKEGQTPGFNTNRKTRKLIVDGLDEVTRPPRQLVHPDVGFAREMETFVWNEKRERYEAAPRKHDDRIMSAAIAVHLTPREWNPAEREGFLIPEHDPMAALVEQIERRLEQEERELAEQGSPWL